MRCMWVVECSITPYIHTCMHVRPGTLTHPPISSCSQNLKMFQIEFLSNEINMINSDQTRKTRGHSEVWEMRCVQLSDRIPCFRPPLPVGRSHTVSFLQLFAKSEHISECISGYRDTYDQEQSIAKKRRAIRALGDEMCTDECSRTPVYLR